jgi:nitroimidazol reductase NimA-like FMN-containing flavoprotein (pyridoxamine 5'-phosphate oxidase superfamily)
MKTIDDRTGLEVLSKNECLLLVGRTQVGRLALVHKGSPVVFPVNFRRDGATIVFRSDEGTKLEYLRNDHPVAFEVDEYDLRSHTGWSVVITGRAKDVTDEEDPETLRNLHVRPWSSGPKARYVRIQPDDIEGRRIVHVTDAHYRRGS